MPPAPGGGSSPWSSRRAGAKLPHQVYFLTNVLHHHAISRFFHFQDGGYRPCLIFEIEIFKSRVLQRHVLSELLTPHLECCHYGRQREADGAGAT